jgi:hypothetical protein
MIREEIWKCTGVDGYAYELLCDIDEAFVHSYCRSVKGSAAKIANAWNEELATEWAMRNYLATKMILASQLLLNVAAYSERKNIVLTHPYLLYYSLLNARRAFLFSDLMLDWRGGKLRTSSHESIRKNTANALRRLSPVAAVEADAMILKAKKQRELLSYSFPASGPQAIPGSLLRIDDTYDVLRLVCELAEVNSECLEAAWKKHSRREFQIDWLQLSDLGTYDAGVGVADHDDHYRLSYLARKYPGPACLVSIATVGMIEDVLGAWCATDDEDSSESDGFDPDAGEAPSIFDFH